MRRPSAALVIPAWNEPESIGAVLDEVPSGLFDSVFVVVPSETDPTAAVASARGADVLVQHTRGYGAACWTGADAAIAHGSEIVAFLDGDYSDPPAALARLLEPLRDGTADLVLGCRDLRRFPDALPPHARVGNRLVCALVGLLLGVRLRDLPSCKAIRADALQALEMREMSYGWTVEMLVKAARRRLRIEQIDVEYRPRRGGRSKVAGNPRASILAAYHLVACALRYAAPTHRRRATPIAPGDGPIPPRDGPIPPRDGPIPPRDGPIRAAAVSGTAAASGTPTGASPRDALVELAARQQPLASPVEAYFEVANRCNSKCATCPLTFSPQEAARQLSLDEFKSLVAQMPDLRRAVLQGIGEPLLNRDLAAMIAHLKERDVYVVFNTNAALLTRRRQVELVESGLDELRVSLDSSTPETYLKVRGIPAFDRVVANVAEMVRTRAAAGSSTPRVSIWMTGLRETLHELPDIVDLAARVGVDEVYLQRLVYWGQGLATSEQSLFGAPSTHGEERGVERAIAEAERRAAQHGIAFRGADARPPRAGLLERGEEAEPWRACSRPLRLAYVTAQGTALPCCIAPFTDAPFESIRLGNYLHDGVAAVWHGEAYQRFREQLYSSSPPAACRNCGLAWSL